MCPVLVSSRFMVKEYTTIGFDDTVHFIQYRNHPGLVFLFRHIVAIGVIINSELTPYLITDLIGAEQPFLIV